MTPRVDLAPKPTKPKPVTDHQYYGGSWSPPIITKPATWENLKKGKPVAHNKDVPVIQKVLALTPLLVLAFIGVLLGWGELGFIHQIIHNWTTVISTSHVQKSIMTSTSHHSLAAEIALGSFLGLVFLLLAIGAGWLTYIIWNDK